MKSILFIAIAALFSTLANAQTASQIKQLEEQRKFLATTDLVYPYIDSSPGYPGGDQKWNQYVTTSNVITKAIEAANQNNIPSGVYVVNVKFTINPDGNLSDIKTVGKPHGFGLEEAARKLISDSGKWIPAHVEGAYTKGSLVLPIRFSIAR